MKIEIKDMLLVLQLGLRTIFRGVCILEEFMNMYLVAFGCGSKWTLHSEVVFEEEFISFLKACSFRWIKASWVGYLWKLTL